MSTLSLLNTSSSQVTANATVSGIGNTVVITNTRIEIQPGANRLVTVNLNVTPSGGGAAIPTELQLLFYDPAFEENDIYGAAKGQGASSGLSSSVI